MGTYRVSVEDFKELFEKFLKSIEGEVHADVVALVWNQLAAENHWSDRLKDYQIPIDVNLSIQDKIILALHLAESYTIKDIVPFSVTQQGLTRLLGVHQPQISKAAKQLEKNNLIKSFMAYSEIASSRKKVQSYCLTSDGKRRAISLKFMFEGEIEE